MKCLRCDAKDSFRVVKLKRKRALSKRKEQAIMECEECGHQERFGTEPTGYQRKRK